MQRAQHHILHKPEDLSRQQYRSENLKSRTDAGLRSPQVRIPALWIHKPTATERMVK